MKKAACLLLPLVLAQCSGLIRDDLRERMPPIPLSGYDPRWGHVKRGDTVVLLADRYAVNGYLLKREPAPNALLMPAGMRFRIKEAGPGWVKNPPCYALSLDHGKRGYQLRLPLADKKAMFPEAVLRSEQIAILPAPPRNPPIWKKW